MKRVLVLVFAGLVAVCAQGYAASYVGAMKGTIKGVYPIYKDADEVTMQAGYGECNGNYFELTAPVDLDLYSALPSGEDYVYIYVDDSASTYPTPTFIGDVTEPVWSDAKLGWYNGDDRCVGAVYSPSTGRTIKEFGYSNDIYMWLAEMDVLTNGNPNGAWQVLETTDKFPVNTSGMLLSCYGYDAADTVRAILTAYELQDPVSGGYCGIAAGGSGYVCLTDTELVPIQRGWTRDIVWKGWDNDDNVFRASIAGYKIER